MVSPANSSIEQIVTSALREDAGVWSIACLDEETLFALAEQGSKLPDAMRHFQHIAQCNYCFNGYRALSEIQNLHLTPAIDPSARSSVPSPAAIFSSGIAGTLIDAAASWLDGVSLSIMRSLEKLQPRTAALSFSDQEGTVSHRQPLQFDDPQAVVTVAIEQGVRWLKIQHREWPAGTLLLVEATEDDGQVVWRQFALLRHGFRQAVTEIALQQDLVEHRRLRVGRVEPFRLPDEAASVLLRSYRADVEIAPAHLSDWKQWAELTRG